MKKDLQFAERLTEACHTSEPAKIQRLLNISYQSAKNYLHGRLPHADLLIRISERTGCSIDWLLTGRGKKSINPAPAQDAPPAAGQIEDSVRRICVEVINEMNEKQVSAQPRIVRLQSSELMSEKIPDAAVPSPREQP
jgi:transcriptional regulator with XRE-family HTH domain